MVSQNLRARADEHTIIIKKYHPVNTCYATQNLSVEKKMNEVIIPKASRLSLAIKVKTFYHLVN